MLHSDLQLPQVKRAGSERVPVRIPAPMVEEIDRIVRELPELNYNRQQFVETAIREKIEKLRTMNTERR
jgi:metal-responsive CopG/Arc/MetJ family transcriptional regulator